MHKKMSPVVHFEMPGEDMGRMRKFYEGVFGWHTNQLGKDMGEYVLVETAETDEKQMLKQPGAINGGFYKKTPEAQNTSVVISVDDIREAMKNVKDAGGKILPGHVKADEPDEIPGVGLFVSIIDTEGNKVGILQPTNMKM